MSLLTVGTVAFDAIETPFGKTDRITGGSGNYICHAAGHFTSNMQLVSVVGDDFSQEELNYLKSIGTDISGIQVIEGQKSFFWSGKYHHDLNKRDTLIVVDSIDEKTYLAFRNLKNCYMIEKQEVNAYLLAVYHSVLIEKSVLEALTKEA